MTYTFPPRPVIHATHSGAGAPVILLHGSAAHAAQWRSMVGCLEGRFKVITPDLPGYGKSAHRCFATMSLEDIARALSPIVDREAEPVHLVGHSFGGAVALKFASLFPGKVASLTLIEPAAFNAVQDILDRTDFVKAGRNSMTAAQEGEPWEAMRFFMDFWNGTGTWGRMSHELRQKMCTQVSNIHRDFNALLGDHFDSEDAVNVRCPSLVITGDASPVEMQRIRDRLMALLPVARAKVIEGAGHLVPMTDPHIVDPMVGEFIAQAASGWQDYEMAA